MHIDGTDATGNAEFRVTLPVSVLSGNFITARPIGANTALFSILDSLMLRSLPVKEPQRLAVANCYPAFARCLVTTSGGIRTR